MSEQLLQVLAFFEISAHPLQSAARCHSAILLVDALVQSLSLTCIDAGNQRASIFPAGQLASLPFSNPPKGSTSHPCNCQALCSSPTKHVAEARYPRDVAEIRKEESRRLAWAALYTYTLFTAKEAELNQTFTPLFITEPFNVSESLLSDSNDADMPPLVLAHVSRRVGNARRLAPQPTATVPRERVSTSADSCCSGAAASECDTTFSVASSRTSQQPRNLRRSAQILRFVRGWR
jgi:hypothetical protein